MTMHDYMFELRGRIPSKKNSRITLRNGRTIPSKAYTEWHKTAEEQLIGLEKEGLDEPLSIRYDFYLPDRRRTDLSNKIESVNDLLVDIGFITDDNANILSTLHVYYRGVDKENPRCEIGVSKQS